MKSYSISPNQKLFEKNETVNSHSYSLPVSISSTINNELQQDEKKVKTTGPIHNPKYKLKPCEKFETDGVCPYFEKCQFAHGSAELEKWMEYHKKSLTKAEKLQHHQAKSPSTPQPKSKASKYSDGDSRNILSSSTTSKRSNTSPNTPPEIGLNRPTHNLSPLSASQYSYQSPIQRNSVDNGNPWQSKRKPFIGAEIPEPPVLSIDSISQEYVNPARSSFTCDEEVNASTFLEIKNKSEINVFDEEKMLQELEKIVSESDDIQNTSTLFKEGILQLPSYRNHSKSAEKGINTNTNSNETIDEGWETEHIYQNSMNPLPFSPQQRAFDHQSYIMNQNNVMINSSIEQYYGIPTNDYQIADMNQNYQVRDSPTTYNSFINPYSRNEGWQSFSRTNYNHPINQLYSMPMETNYQQIPYYQYQQKRNNY